MEKDDRKCGFTMKTKTAILQKPHLLWLLNRLYDLCAGKSQTSCRQILIEVSNRWFMTNGCYKICLLSPLCFCKETDTHTHCHNESASTNQMGPWQPFSMLCTTEAGATSLHRKWWASTVSLKYPSTRAAKARASALEAICNSWKRRRERDEVKERGKKWSK